MEMRRKKSLWQLRKEALAREANKTEVVMPTPQQVPDEHRKKVHKVKRWRTRHHLVPKSRGGSMSKCNLLYVDGNVHRRWHEVFGNRTLEEVIALLIRVQQAKANQGF